MSHWSEPFIGLPYRDLGRDRRGVDCWGLAVLVYAEVLGVTLPSFTGRYASAGETADVRALIGAEKEAAIFRAVPVPAAFDLLGFNRGRGIGHVGIAINATQMLHIQGGDQAKVERYREGRWKARLSGVYRVLEAPVKEAS